MNKKTTLILSIGVILLLCVLACIIPAAKHMYNSYMYFSGPSRLIEDEEKIVPFEKENKGIKDVHGYPGEIPNDVFNSLNEIYGSFTSEFSYILVKEGFVHYGGIGPTMYKYSINGEAPTYF